MARTRRKNAATTLFDAADRPIYVLDAERRIQYCNVACSDWVGCASAELIGHQCHYHSPASKPGRESLETDSMVAGICPSIDAFAGIKTVGVVSANRNGASRRRRAEFIPLSCHEPFSGVLVIVDHEDLTNETTKPWADVAFDPVSLHDQLRLWRQHQADRYALEDLLGCSTRMHRVREQVRLAAAGTCSIVAVGAPGTARERVLRTIHSARCATARIPLIPLDCALLDSELVQSTVDGVVRQFHELAGESAAELLLLEVDQLSLDAQATLSECLRAADFPLRTLATARVDLLQLASQERFRSDLADDLSTLVITLPPLAERTEDIPLLVQAAIEQSNSQGGKQIQGVSERAMNLLLAHRWSGNVDQLFESIHQAHAKSSGPRITELDLPDAIRLSIDADRHPTRQHEVIELESYLADIERELIRRALATAKGNKAQAARLLGVSRGRLLRRLGALKIDH